MLLINAFKFDHSYDNDMKIYIPYVFVAETVQVEC